MRAFWHPTQKHFGFFFLKTSLFMLAALGVPTVSHHEAEGPSMSFPQAPAFHPRVQPR